MKKLLLSILVTFILVSNLFLLSNYGSTDIINGQDGKLSKNNNEQISKSNEIKSLNQAQNNFDKTGPIFIENNGQLKNESIRFYSEARDIWFTDGGVWFEVWDELATTSRQSAVHSPKSKLMTDNLRLMTSNYKRVILKQEFLGANRVQPVGRSESNGQINYLSRTDEDQWNIGAKNYKEIIYENLYENIDLVYIPSPSGYKYEFIIHPGGDLDDIRIEYKGAPICTDGENIFIETPISQVIDSELYCYQRIQNKNVKVDSKFKLLDNIIQFDIDYDPKYTLIIDPLVYSTFIGGTEKDHCSAIEIDENKNVYITGFTKSTDFPNTTGVHSNKLNQQQDVFVTKLDPTGSKLIYSTYIGGSGIDASNDVIIDSEGNAFVTGETDSYDFPTTNGAYKTKLSNNTDIFIFKLDPSGSKLQYSTYVGGSADDSGFALATDPTGNVYVTGVSNSIDFPTTNDAYDSINEFDDAFLLKLNSKGTELIYSTLLGGNLSDKGYGIDIDSEGYVYITGETSSGNFPTSNDAFDDTYSNRDGFITKMDKTGSNIIYSTFIGGDKPDSCEKIKVDTSGGAIIIGHTESPNFPVTELALDKKLNGISDGFVLKLTPPGTELEFSTYIGGNDLDWGVEIYLDSIEDIYITGSTQSFDFPLSDNAIDTQCDWVDAFFMKLDKNATKIIYSTYLGGENNDFGQDLALHPMGIICLAGNTYSPDLLTTPAALETKYNGNMDIFVSRLDDNLPYIDLVSPENDVRITTDKVELRWKLRNTNRSDVYYDIILDTIYPPKEIIKSNYNESMIVIKDLFNEETYYWMIIPYTDDDLNLGSSNIWSFDVLIKTQTPAVTLMYPRNDSTIQTQTPTLLWSVSYSGSRALSYDIYMSIDENPDILVEGHEESFYIPSEDLEDGVTYYWKIVPIAGDIPAPGSEIWSFQIIPLEDKPEYDLELSLSPPFVQLAPGENETIFARVENKGSTIDTFYLNITKTSLSNISVQLPNGPSVEVSSGNSGEVGLKVVVPPETKIGNYQFIIRVSSINALIERGLDIYDNINLTVIVLEPDKPDNPDESERSEDDSLLIIILVSIIIIIIAMELGHRFNKAKKDDEEIKPNELKKKLPKKFPKEKD